MKSCDVGVSGSQIFKPSRYETVRDWEARFAPLLAAQLRAKRRGTAGPKWHVDETYVKVKGRWCQGLCASGGWRLKPRLAGLRATKPACAGWVR
jgi:hypothetical protein